MNFPELDPFAVERSHRTSQIANEHSRATAQACILINGGAATAAIAFLSKNDIPAAYLSTVPKSIVLYTVGVVFGSLMMFCMTQAMEQFNNFWYYMSHGASEEKAKMAHRKAGCWQYGYNVCFVAATLCFGISSGLLGFVLYAPK